MVRPSLRHACSSTALAAALAAALASASAVAMPPTPPPEAGTVLVYTRTAGYRHDSIPKALATLRALADAQGLRVDSSDTPGAFTPRNLARYRVVVFASTTGDVLDAAQQAAFEDWLRRGGGFVGIHAAADTEYGWPWYGQLVGARFAHHPPGLQNARLRFADGATWRVTDEFYDYDRNPRGDVRVIAVLDERDYPGGRMGDDHPIAWCHARLGGRAWYTGLGHDAALYDDARFRAHLSRGLRYAAGLADDC